MKLRKVLQLSGVGRWVSRLAIVFVAVGAPLTAHADTILAKDASGFPAHNLEFDGTVGYRFDVGGSAFDVTMLGFYDFAADGLNTSHDVGIFGLTGNLLASTTVDAGNAEMEENFFRWSGLASPLRLEANTSYIIAATMVGGDRVDIARHFAIIDPLFTVQSAALYDFYVSGPTLFAPTTPFLDNGVRDQGLFGPNLRGTAVPDGGSMLTLLGLSAMGIATLRRRFT